MLKTNLIQEGRDGGPPTLPTYRDGAIDRRTIDEAVNWIGTLRDAVGPSIGIAVDVQFDYRMGGIVQLARALEPFNLYWLEVESFDPDALLAAREQTTTRLCHGESLIRREQFRPFFQKHVTDVVMIETLANGLSESRRIAEMAELYDTMVSPHNWMSPLGTLINAHLCAARLERRDPRDRPRRRALEGRPADPPARDRGRPAGRPGPAGLGRRHRRGGRPGPSAPRRAPAVKITAIEPITCDSGIGGRDWLFVKVTTDEGIVGWGEGYDWHAGVGRWPRRSGSSGRS